MSHTPEPWEAVTPCPGQCCWLLQQVRNEHGMFGRISYPEMSEEDANRIVACVNACAGISTDALEEAARTGKRVAEMLQQQRDELLAAAKNYADMYLQDERDERGMCYDMQHHEDVVALFAAIAKAEGEPINGGGRPL